jgi:hypothetical protein
VDVGKGRRKIMNQEQAKQHGLTLDNLLQRLVTDKDGRASLPGVITSTEITAIREGMMLLFEKAQGR